MTALTAAAPPAAAAGPTPLSTPPPAPLRRVSPSAPGPTALSAAIWAAAVEGDAERVLALFEEEGYCSIDTRSLYQSTLLHAAARHGHVRLAVALLERGANVNALDWGGMRRTPLHWACKGGHVALVELLVAAGADTKADGRSWSTLVQGLRCGSLIPTDSPTESADSLCTTNAVRLALMQPPWQPSIHALWPQRFRDAARLLLLASGCSDDGGGSQHGGGHFAAGAAAGAGARKGSARGLPLARDAVLEVLAAAAYPVSAWL